MNDAADQAPPNLICAVWGPLDKADRYEHMDCPVIVRHPGEGVLGSPARSEPLPLVCKCECHTCKRAWWAAGRPIIRDGVIVTDRDAARGGA